VLLTGATGFVGQHLAPHLKDHELRRASRRPPAEPGWVRLDLDDVASIPAAVEGVATIVYLVHAMADGGDYAARERAAATALGAAAKRAGVEHIVYLGGVVPRGTLSHHLQSRLATGEALRQSGVPVTELRAGVILGEGSASWEILRDLAARLPAMIYPRWLRHRLQPIAIDDVVAAIAHAIELGPSCAGIHDLPGPETISGEDLLARVARAIGLRPFTLRVPLLTPRLSAYWLRFVTGADYAIASQLVEGLKSDLVADGNGFWALFPGHTRLPLDAAIASALQETRAGRSTRSLAVEWLIQRLGRSA